MIALVRIEDEGTATSLYNSALVVMPSPEAWSSQSISSVLWSDFKRWWIAQADADCP